MQVHIIGHSSLMGRNGPLVLRLCRRRRFHSFGGTGGRTLLRLARVRALPAVLHQHGNIRRAGVGALLCVALV